jgi:mono/diheme cytochrome c family protein
MSNASQKAASARRVAGVLAEFDSAEVLKAAAMEVRDEGFTRWDAHSPFPIHGMQRAMGMRPTPLPWLVLAAGIVGGVTALVMQWWMNAIAYPHVISGKPLFSLPANIPVIFELIILFSALAAFGGAMMLGRLPQFWHFTFRDKRFRQVTTDGFFISIAADDTKFDESETPRLLDSLGAAGVEVCEEATSGAAVPGAVGAIMVIAAALALVPPLWIALIRGETTERPPIHLVADMDFQPRYNPQSYNGFFPDRRAMRPPVPNTIALGDLHTDEHFYLGYRIEQVEEQAQERGEGVADSRNEIAKADDDHRDYFSTFPAQVRDNMGELIGRGQERFGIYCAACHGLMGNGQGIVSLRALKREEPDWLVPTSLHVPAVRNQPVGQLFNTITNGKGKMPSYASQIPVEDRWAIVLYERALQRSQNTTIKDFPKEVRSQLR